MYGKLPPNVVSNLVYGGLYTHIRTDRLIPTEGSVIEEKSDIIWHLPASTTLAE